MKGTVASDIDLARKSNRTAVFIGFQNPSPIEDDIGLIEIVHTLGARFMQLSYNNQSLLATGCYESVDTGITRMGKQVIKDPHHLKDKSQCTVESFCQMIADTADKYGIEHLGIGTDLCQDQPDSVVEWMRIGRWIKEIDYGEGSADNAGFPPMPPWFKDNRDFDNIENGMRKIGMSADETAAAMGGNWYRFYSENFSSVSDEALYVPQKPAAH